VPRHKQFIRKTLEPYLKHTGGAMSPFTAWIMLKGLETMDLRVRAQAATALSLAQALEGHPSLSRVIYPGLASHPQHAIAVAQNGSGGTVLSIDLGSREAAFRFLNALRIFIISNNLGDAKSIVTPPGLHHPPAPAAGAEGSAGHHPGPRPPELRDRGRGRPPRRPPGGRSTPPKGRIGPATPPSRAAIVVPVSCGAHWVLRLTQGKSQ
jgi:hypothetical protein